MIEKKGQRYSFDSGAVFNLTINTVSEYVRLKRITSNSKQNNGYIQCDKKKNK